MVVIPAGTFQMGDVQGGGDKDEQPVHAVRIRKPFAIGRYEVTFDDYDRFAKSSGKSLPSDVIGAVTSSRSSMFRGKTPWNMPRGCRTRQASVIDCPRRRSGNMQRGRGPKPSTIGVTI